MKKSTFLLTLMLAVLASFGVGAYAQDQALTRLMSQTNSHQTVLGRLPAPAMPQWSFSVPGAPEGYQSTSGLLKSQAPRRAAVADGTEIWGLQLSWVGNDVMPVGCYQFNASPNSTYKLLHQDKLLYCSGGSVTYDGVMHTIAYAFEQGGGDMTPWYTEYDINTWEQLRCEAVSNYFAVAQDVAHDPITGKNYGIFWADNSWTTYAFGEIDYETLTMTPIITLPQKFVAIAINSKGVCYGIDLDGDLYIINKETGAQTLVGNTGVKPLSYNQSMTFDLRKDRLYWAAMAQELDNGLYVVDTETAKAEMIFAFGKEELGGLYVPYVAAEDGAPAKITDLSVVFEGASLTGKVSFTMPTLTYNEQPLEGMLDYEILVNGEVVMTSTASAGAAIEETITVTGGQTTITVHAKNSVGTGPDAVADLWIGPDVPLAPTEVELDFIDEANGQVWVGWEAPTMGVHGIAVDPDELTYRIVRQPDNVTVADDYVGDSFTETLERGSMKRYSYAVYAKNGAIEGEPGISNGLLFGKGLELPYTQIFDERSSMDLFVTLDLNNNGQSWDYSPVNQSAISEDLQGYFPADDWLLTPELHFEANRYYHVSFKARNVHPSVPETISAAFVQGSDVSNGIEVIAETTLNTNYALITLEGKARVEKEGYYRLGFHVNTPQSQRVIVDDIVVTAGAVAGSPAEVENLSIKPGAKGAMTASVSFNAPTTDIDGAAITSLTKVDILRNDFTTVKTFEAPTPGEALSFSEDIETRGQYKYTVVAYNDKGMGMASSETIYVGMDRAKRPDNIILQDMGDYLRLTWEQDTVGYNGGYVSLDDMMYVVYYNKSMLGFDIPGFSYDITNITTTGKQQYVSASLQGYDYVTYETSQTGVSNSLLLGDAYELPFHESFANKKVDNDPWSVNGDVTAFGLTETGGSDADGGCAFWNVGSGTWAALSSPKISMEGTFCPQVHFSYYAVPGHDMTIYVLASPNQIDQYIAATINCKELTGDFEWREATVDLTAFKNNPYLCLSFFCQSTEQGMATAIDDVSVYDVLPFDLSISLATPDKMVADKATNLVATVSNIGTSDAEAYTVNLYVNGEVAATQEGENLAVGESREHTFSYSVASDATTMDVYAEVVFENDADPSNNQTPEKTLEVLLCPAVQDFTGTPSGSDIVLSWTAPEVKPMTVNEDFELYDPFIIDGIGKWKMVDMDGGPVYSIGMDFDHSTDAFAWIVFNATGFPYGFDKVMAAHSGSQCLVAMASSTDVTAEGHNDDWLISPELSGDAQMISFWAKAASSWYTESFEILCSTTGNNVEDFELVEKHDIASEEWTSFSALLPEGAKYFAIRYTSTFSFALLLDDFTFNVAGNQIDHYNVYRNYELIATLAPDVTTYTDEGGMVGKNYYYVTVSYQEGESEKSEIIDLIPTAIRQADAAGLQCQMGRGQLTVASAQPVQVYAASGALMASTNGKRQTLRLPAGTYIVKSGAEVKHVLVK